MKCVTCGEPARAGFMLCERCRETAAALERERGGASEAVLALRLSRAMSMAIVSTIVTLACSSGPVPCSHQQPLTAAALAARKVQCDKEIDACETIDCVDAVVARCKGDAETLCKEK